MKTPKQCCFCLPLRKGLLILAYSRLIICLLTIAEFALMSVDMFMRMQDSYEDAVSFLKSVATIIPQLLDLIFTLMFIVAAHKKNHKLVEIYYLYSITLTLVYSLVVILVSCDIAREPTGRFDMLYYMMFQYAWFIEAGYLEFVGMGVSTIVLQVYMTLLVKSEVHRLKEKNRAELARQRSSISFRLPKFNRLESNAAMA